MQPVKEKIKGIKYDLSFELDTKNFEKELDFKLQDFAKNHSEKGFRKGHVPLSVIKTKYENHFINDVLNEMINKTLQEYCSNAGISFAASPNVKIDEFVRCKNIKFSVNFEILPQVKEIDFGKITLEKQIAKAGDKEIDEAIKNIANSKAKLVEVKENRKTKKGDNVDIDFVGSVDGVEFEGGSAKNYLLELGSGSFIKGFEEQLEGYNIKDEVNVNVVFPKDYGKAELANKKALFKVKINAIKEKIIPVIDDKFATELNRKDVADLKIYIKELLENNYETYSKNLMKDELLEKLSEEKIETPEVLVTQEIEYMLYQFKTTSSVKMDTKTEEKKKDEFKKQAISRVKLGLILAEVGKKEKIQIENNEIQNAIIQEAMKYPSQSKQIFEYYTKNPQAQDTIKAGIFEDKVLDFILSKVKIKEKQVEQNVLLKTK